MKNLAIVNTFLENNYDIGQITIINDILNNFYDVNASVFTTAFNIKLPYNKFCILPIHEAKYYKGKCVVWDFMSLELVLNFPNIDKIIYLHDNTIPWNHNRNIAYNVWERLFTNNKVQILITDIQIADIFRLTFSVGKFVEAINSRVIYEEL